MFPLHGESERVNHPLSLVLGPKHAITSRKSWIPQVALDIRFQGSSAERLALVPAPLGHYGVTPVVHLTLALDWTPPWIPGGMGTLDPFLT